MWTQLSEPFSKPTTDEDSIEGQLLKEYAKVEEVFSAEVIKKEVPEEDLAALKSPTTTSVSFLDPKRAQNVNITIKGFKLTTDQLVDALRKVDDAVLETSLITSLLKFVPTEEEIGMMSQYDDAPEQLAPAERFMYSVSKIPLYESRLKALEFRSWFLEEGAVDGADMVRKIRLAIDAVKKSTLEKVRLKRGGYVISEHDPKFAEVLKVILGLGNFLNGKRGPVYGFKLDALVKLGDTKSSVVEDRKYTLLHYMAELFEDKMPHLSDFTDELVDVEDATRVAMADLRALMKNIKDGVAQVQTLVNQLSRMPDKGGSQSTKGFERTMKDFHAHAKALYEDLTAKVAKIDTDYDQLCTVFGEEASKLPSEEFFGIFWKFCVDYQQAKVENENARIKKKEKEKKEKQQREFEEKRKKRKGGDLTPLEKPESVMSLLSPLAVAGDGADDVTPVTSEGDAGSTPSSSTGTDTTAKIQTIKPKLGKSDEEKLLLQLDGAPEVLPIVGDSPSDSEGTLEHITEIEGGSDGGATAVAVGNAPMTAAAVGVPAGAKVVTVDLAGSPTSSHDDGSEGTAQPEIGGGSSIGRSGTPLDETRGPGGETKESPQQPTSGTSTPQPTTPGKVVPKATTLRPAGALNSLLDVLEPSKFDDLETAVAWTDPELEATAAVELPIARPAAGSRKTDKNDLSSALSKLMTMVKDFDDDD